MTLQGRLIKNKHKIFDDEDFIPFQEFENTMIEEMDKYSDEHRTCPKAILVCVSIYKWLQLYRVIMSYKEFDDEIYINCTLILPYDKLEYGEYEIIGRELGDTHTKSKEYLKMSELREAFLKLLVEYWN